MPATLLAPYSSSRMEGIFLLDSKTAVRHLLRQSIEGTPPGRCVVGEAPSAQEALAFTQEHSPALIIADTYLPDMGALPFVRRVRHQYPGVRLLLFSSWSHANTLQPFLDAGVHGIVFRDHPLERLFQAIDTILEGGCHFAMEPVAACSREQPRALTERETVALCLIAKGCSTKEMASEMGISVKTAEKYRERLMHKLELHDAVRLTRFAIRNGLVTP